VIIDARVQAGLTQINAQNAVQRAINDLPHGRVREIRVFGREDGRDYQFTRNK